jgi:hypothetical protein
LHHHFIFLTHLFHLSTKGGIFPIFLLNYSSLHSFKQPKTYQTVPAVPTGSNDQEYSLGQQGIDFCTTEFNVQNLKALLVSI